VATPADSVLAALARFVAEDSSDEDRAWTWITRFRNDAAGAGASGGTPGVRFDGAPVERALRGAGDDAAALARIADEMLGDTTAPERLETHVHALEIALRAAALAPASTEACRAQARALESVFLRTPAVAAWERCLDLEADPVERSRIREHLAGLAPRTEPPWEPRRLIDAARAGDGAAVRAIVRAEPDRARRFVEGELFPEWADDVHAGEGEAADRMAATLEFVGAAIREIVGDAVAADAAAAIGRATRSGEIDRVHELAAAHRAYREATPLVTARELDAARPQLTAAERQFARADSSFRFLARYQLGVVGYSSAELTDAARLFASLREDLAARAYPSLLAAVNWMEGLVLGRRARLSDSLVRFREATRLYAAIGDDERRAAAAALVAETYDRLGEVARAWQQRHASLSDLADVAVTRARRQTLAWAGDAAWRQGLPRAAAAFEGAVPHRRGAGARGGRHARRSTGLARARLGRSAARESGGSRRRRGSSRAADRPGHRERGSRRGDPLLR
jgi:hypothetical protein